MKHSINTYTILSEYGAQTDVAARLRQVAAMPTRKWRKRERLQFFSQLSADRRAIKNAYKQLRNDRLYGADYYVVEKAMLALEDLWDNCPHDLPADAFAESMGVPRIYHVASLISAHALNDAYLTETLEAYQQIQSLNMRELWVLPDVLRVSLLKRLRILLEKSMHQKEADNYRALQRCLSDLRYLENWDAQKIFETHATVEKMLSKDEVYAQMDTDSRAYYRACVERLSRELHISETAVAQNALLLSHARASYRAHVGYYLADEGIRELKAQLRPDKRQIRFSQYAKLTLFIAFQLILSVLLLYWAWESWWTLLAALPAWSAANAFCANLFLRFSKQSYVPRLHVQNGRGVLVVIPTLLASTGNLENAMRQMETHYLANRLPGVCFAVLGDFKDAECKEQSEGEEALLREAESATAKLNAKYEKEDVAFYFLHRKRTLCKADGRYMGRERKRGALEDLLRLLVDKDTGPFALRTGELPEIEHILTLDEDTILPLETLQCFIGAARHPLNQPVRDRSGRLLRGYGVIFPVMRITAQSAAKNAFSNIMAGDPGVESYKSCVSEFYMNVFGTGIFGGKGIWNVREYLLASQNIPSGRVLCHDLLEGSFSRAALMSDVSLYDTEMGSCAAWWKRAHRWIRGDWQLLPFWKRVPVLTRYQIFENLRRSLTPVAELIMLLALPSLSWRFACLALLTLFYAPLSAIFRLFTGRRADRKAEMRAIERLFRRALFDLSVLPYAAWRSIDAILRALYRMLISHKKMLEWQTAAQTTGAGRKRGAYFQNYSINLIFGALQLLQGYDSVLGLISGMLWLFFPLCLHGLERTQKAPSLSRNCRAELMDTAERTWGFFVRYANENTGYLPPDNVQESPAKAPVMRTSPTNAGMAAVSALSAYDLGFLDKQALCDRLGRMADTLEALEAWHGHLYNWYELLSMQPSEPRYISSVDSGNFACAMLACAQAAIALKEDALGERLRALALRCDFSYLYDQRAHLFYIGYDCQNGALSPSHYDLLASEARLLSFISIALGQTEKRHWFTLGRLLTPERTLMSWGGTMFEYLMPLIFTGQIKDTLLSKSCIGAVQTQMSALSGGVWGISESAYYGFDRQMYYQYAPFGVPSLALSDKEREDVIAPYAALLALMVAPNQAYENLQRLKKLGALGEFGFYEAVDFERSRVGDTPKIIKSYMAHHQGMGLCAVADLLRDGSVRRRFLQTPEVHAARLLLEEKVPQMFTIKPLPHKEKSMEYKEMPFRNGKKGDFPETQLLSNGRYTVFCSEWGGGFSRCEGTMLTRWRPELRKGRNVGGVRVYLASNGEAWEISGAGENAGGEFSAHEVRLHCIEHEISARMRVCVSAQRSAEIREIVVSNRNKEEQTLTLGVFFEVCLTSQIQDMAHPAFQKLRVDAFCEEDVLLFMRRSTPEEAPSWVYCLLYGAKARFCTERLVMPGRGRSEEEAMLEPLPDTPLRSPIEPGCHIRTEFSLLKEDAKRLRLILGWAGSKEEALRDARILREENVWEFAQAYARSELYFLGVEAGQAASFERLAGELLLRANRKENTAEIVGKPLERLWAKGISGDLPILLLRCNAYSRLPVARTAAKFLRYYQAKGERCDLVILGEYSRAYGDPLREELEKLRAPHVFVLHEKELDNETLNALTALCSIELDEAAAELKNRIQQKAVPACCAIRSPSGTQDDFAIRRPACLNGTHGFDTDNGDYLIYLAHGAQTPLPWCNILCNERFGTLISERGGGYTWAANSRMDKITPWHNDPVEDRENEVILFTDEESGESWNPLRDKAPLCVRHSTGYSTYTCGARALYMRMRVFTDPAFPYKYTLLELENPLMRPRSVGLRYCVEWRLGDLPHNEALKNSFDGHILRVFNERERQGGFMALLPNAPCKAEYGAGCSHAELHVSIKLLPGERCERLFLIGAGDAPAAPPTLEDAYAALERVKAGWKERLNLLRVKTDDEDMNRMLNVWLPYQTESSRLRARTGYYQCGGAVGFRDQLQDMLSVKMLQPERLRAHILYCASMQFKSGDVLHWWHPGDGFVTGVRTHIRDDRLFLPYALLEYLLVTEDMSILNEQVAYLKDIPLPEGQRDVYTNAYPSDEKDSLYAHCTASLYSMDMGSHGLCLMGGGDWNDAMDRVGDDGGESVWLSFFLLYILERFAKISGRLGRGEDETAFLSKAEALRAACERAWDGSWYRRAYFGDGFPLGNRDAQSCAIDCITQSWAVLCKASHAQAAFEGMLGMLLDEEYGILKLLSPPFSPEDSHPAGYIQAYLPGVRENGGQYTHGACWAVMAACELGLKEQAEKLFKLLLPTSHTATEQACLRYKGEPYVAAGDVYALERAGRAGWTWYTGAAGWLYTLGIEYILGIRRRGDKLLIAPSMSAGFSFCYRCGKSLYSIEVRGPKCKRTISIQDDGENKHFCIE